MPAHQFGMKRQRRLRDRGHAHCLRGQHEARDIAAAIDRPVNAKRFVGMNNGDMRRTEEVEILQRLPGVTHLVTSDYAERVVELEAACAAVRMRSMVKRGTGSGLNARQENRSLSNSSSTSMRSRF